MTRRNLGIEDLYEEYVERFDVLLEAAWQEFLAEVAADRADPMTREEWLVDAEVDDDCQTGLVSKPQPFHEWLDAYFESQQDWNNYV